ncbi:MAG TPA: DegT/DnrJ/EryC1/StrS family aminotransferase [Planctomycetota bacterium]|nr:DegT/DnrJ/EryC1/StrS family aminotransferase [Planctomycetota bacterium]
MHGDPEFLPFCRPTLGEEEIASVVESLRSGWITSGPKVLAFEAIFRERLGVPHAVAVNSATAGLHVALAGLGIGPGDEVITTSLTWPSTVNMIELLGARPVFADVIPGTLMIDPADVRRRINERTRAIVPVHYAGAPADLDALDAAIAQSGRAIALLEDAAHALGTAYKGREIGAGPHTTVYSFHPIKNITTGEGGIVTTRDEKLADRMRTLRFHGVSKDAWSRYGRSASPRYEVIEPGWKYNMLDLQAALGIEQMKKLERFNGQRAELAARYGEALADVAEVRPLDAVPYDHVHAWHLYIVRLDLARLSIGRDEFMGELGKAGVGVGLHFTPVHLHRFYAEKYGFRVGDLPASEAAGESIFSLPLYPLLTPAMQDRVVAAVKQVVAAHKAPRGR